MRRQLGSLLAAVVVMSGCTSETPSPPASATSSPPVASTSASGDPSLVTVPATSNIFGAGHDLMPQPAGGGGGTPPPLIPLAPADQRIVFFEDVVGTVIPIVDIGLENGPEGTGGGRTDIESTGGISGIVHDSNQMFLVGVFLTDAEPADPAPERLDASDDFRNLAPNIAQVFLIGDGVGHQYVVPDEATRLFLGFADANRFLGEVGFYGNNTGSVQARVTFTLGVRD